MLRELLEFQSDYSPSDVLSRVSAIEKQTTSQDDTVSFGLEDSDGNIIKVHVASDEAEDFEAALGKELASLNDESDTEIAELLYNMHDDFNIVNVEWPNVVEDEESESTEMEGGEPGEGGEFGEEGDMEDGASPDFGGDDELGGDDVASTDSDMGDSGVRSALDSVLAAMTADSEAKRQEAIAKAAEARAKEADAAARMAEQKLRSEEEVADMEAYYTGKNEEQKEAKKLAKLAKYRHDTKRDQSEQDIDSFGDALSAQQNDNTTPPDTRDPEEQMGMEDEGGELDMGMSGDDGMESPTQDLDTEMDNLDIENEESVDGPDNVNRKFKELEDMVAYLQSMKVRKTVHNN